MLWAAGGRLECDVRFRPVPFRSSLVAEYYQSLFESHAGQRVEELLQHVPTRVTDEMNNHLMGEYTEEEIKVST